MKLQKNNFWIFIAIASTNFFVMPSHLIAATYAEKTLQQKNQFILPARITVGPNDNFQTAVSLDGKSIFYTSSTHLAARIFTQEINTHFSRSLIDERTDSKDPAISADGTLLAFTSFQHNARGDICLYSLADKKIRCVTNRDTENRSPFWIDAHRIGFLTRKAIAENFSVVVASIDHLADDSIPTPTILFSGDIADPTASNAIDGARWLTYTRVDQNKSVIELRKLIDTPNGLSAASPIAFTIDLPGLSSFPRFDPQGEFLYFGQYTTDTNDDQQLDAHDRSALYRVRLRNIFSRAEIFPEPLTSIDTNCNYPIPTTAGLFMTCSSPTVTDDASLDIYRMPLDGMIPTHWNEKQILRGIETSRSYSDRILLYYALLARFPKHRNAESLEKILSNYITDKQYPAAIFYANKLAKTKGNEKNYALLEILLSASLQAKQQADEEGTSDFRSTIDRDLAQVRSLRASWPEWNPIVEATLLSLQHRNAEAKNVFGTIRVASIQNPLALYFYSEIAGGFNLLDRDKNLSLSSILSEASQVYYAYDFLQESDRVYPNESARISFLKNLQAKLPTKSVLSAFLALDLRLADFKSDDVHDAGNQKVYADILRQLSLAQSRYFLYRAMLTRSITTLSKKSFWTYMEFISIKWVSFEVTSDSEYAYAREQFLSIGLERGYGLFSERQWSFAGDQFSNTAGLTDDLEAHHGFIRSRLAQNRQSDIDKMYQTFKKDGAIDQNLLYVSALLDTIDFTTKHPNEIDSKLFQSHLKALEGMTENGFNPALRYLLMGYFAQQLFVANLREGAEDANNFQKADRYYMLALDLSRDNERVVPVLLFNLGILHQEVGNHGQSLSFFELRKNYLFEDQNEKAAFAWYYAKSFFYNQQPQSALDVIANFLKDKDAQKNFPEFLEKAAFYSAQSKNFSRANRYYQEFFKAKPALLSSTTIDSIRTKMGYAYTLFKLKKFSDATKQFQAITNAKTISSLESKELGRSLPLIHYQLIALGFLAQMEMNPQEKIRLLTQRLDFFRKAGSNLNAIFLKQDDWLSTIVTIQNQIAAVDLKRADSTSAMASLSASLDSLAQLKNLDANPLDKIYVDGLRNYFAGVKIIRATNPSFAPKNLSKALALASFTHSALEQIPELKSIGDYASFENLYLQFK